jgi:aryl-alcohol dehydrogenase-like predicted oxidoreductase
VNFRRLGRTELKISEVGLGTVELGMEYGIADGKTVHLPTREAAARVLNQALDSGINYLDTARAYGVSEEVIGGALKSRRKEYVLASKVGAPADVSADRAALRAHVTSSVEQSLKALQTDVIDLMQLHSIPTELIRRGDIAEVLQELQRAGSIRFLGATTYGEESARVVLEDGRYDCIQIAYSILDREPETTTLPLAQSKDIAVVVRSVLLKGALSHRYRHLPGGLEELKAAVEKILAIAESMPAGLPEIAYRFVLAHPAVSSALVGTALSEELMAAVDYARRGPLTPECLARLQQVTIRDRKLLNPGNWPAESIADRATRK